MSTDSQENFTPDRLERTALDFLKNPARLRETRAALAAVRPHLGAPDSPDRAAAEIISLL